MSASRVVVRTATAADTDVLAQLRVEWTDEVVGSHADDTFVDRFRDWFRAESHRRVWWLAETAGRPVGMVNLTLFERMPRPGLPPRRWGYVANVFVLEAHRNQRIGEQLMAAVITYSRVNDLGRVVLSPSARSRPFYERIGFGSADMLMARRFGETD